MFGTSENNHCANCRFYLKTGACRRGERCSDLHICPTISPTLLLYHMYHRPLDAQGHPIIDTRKIQEHFEDFYEDIFEELIKFGEIECLTVCDNLADHLSGNVYVMFKEEYQAAAALEAFRRRAYCGNPVLVDFSPVMNFRAALCYEDSNCLGAYYCNYMHVKQIGRSLSRKLFGKERLRSLNRSITPQYRAHSDGRGSNSFGRGGDYGGRQSADWLGGCNDDKGRRRFGSPRGSRSPRGKGYHRAYSEGWGSNSFDHGDDYHGNRRQSADKHGVCIDDRGRRGFESPRRSRSPTRERSVERRDRIERWNRERERDSFDHGGDYYGNGRRSADVYRGCNDDRGRRGFESLRHSRSPRRERSVERRAKIEPWNREKEQRW